MNPILFDKEHMDRNFVPSNLNKIIFIKIRDSFHSVPISKLQNAGIFAFILEQVNDAKSMVSASHKSENLLIINAKCFEINIPEKYDSVVIENCINLVSNGYNFGIIGSTTYADIVKIASLAEYMCINKEYLNFFLGEYLDYNEDIYDILDKMEYDPTILLIFKLMHQSLGSDIIKQRAEEIVSGKKLCNMPSECKIEYISNLIIKSEYSGKNPLHLITRINMFIIFNNSKKNLECENCFNYASETQRDQFHIKCSRLYEHFLTFLPNVLIQFNNKMEKIEGVLINKNIIEVFNDDLESENISGLWGLGGFNLIRTFSTHLAKILLQYETL